MEQRPSWEANKSSATQESSHFMKIGGSYQIHEPAICPYPKPIDPKFDRNFIWEKIWEDVNWIHVIHDRASSEA
jgi:hypothetical protein